MGEISCLASQNRQQGNQLFLSLDNKVYTKRAADIRLAFAYSRVCARFIYCLLASGGSLKSNNRWLWRLTAEVIEHNHIIFYTEWVQEIKHSLGHHRRTTQVPRCPLERRVAWGRCRPPRSNEAWSVLHTMNASALVSGRSLTREEVREIKRNNDGLMTDWD